MIIIGITWNEDGCHVEKLVSGEVEFNLETAVFTFVFVLVFAFVFVLMVWYGIRCTLLDRFLLLTLNPPSS